MSTPRTPYLQGFQDGWQDTTHEDVGEQKALVLELAERAGAALLSPEEESNHWLGFYHSRQAARTGRNPFTRN